MIGGGVVGAGAALDAATRGPVASAWSRRATSPRGTLEPLQQADPRRPALPRDARLRPGARGAARARAAAHQRSRRTSCGRCRSCTRCTHRGLGARSTSAPGIALYDAMAAAAGQGAGLPRHRHLTRRQRPAADARACASDALVGAIQYYDAQVDDARHTMTLARTAAAYGALVANRARVVGLPARGRARHRRPGATTWRSRRASSRSGPSRSSTPPGVWTDDTQAHGRRARPVPRPRLQGHPPRGAARPHPLAHRA